MLQPKPDRPMKSNATRLYPEIERAILELKTDIISPARKAILQPLADYLQTKVNSGNHIRLSFICTHNSRRSHLCQVWAQAMGCYFGVEKLYCYSAGTETTALYPAVADTLRASGFRISELSQSPNPVYGIKYGPDEHPVIGFSKNLEHPFNPASGFAAIMTCDSANETCPFVPGAEKRFAMTFEDPKAFDQTPQQKEKYSERSLQIATELLYVFSQINKNGR